jgi:hypothetical protein
VWTGNALTFDWSTGDDTGWASLAAEMNRLVGQHMA